MLHELEERYPWMKQFHGQWAATVLMGKHDSSKSRDMHKALGVRWAAKSTPFPASRPTSSLSPVVMTESSSALSTSGSIGEENEYSEEEHCCVHDSGNKSVGEDEIDENINEESNNGENTYRDDSTEEEEDPNDQSQVSSFILKSQPANNMVHRVSHLNGTRPPPLRPSTLTAFCNSNNRYTPDMRLRARVIQSRVPAATTNIIVSTRYESETSTTNKCIKPKSTEPDKSTSARSNIASKNITTKKQNHLRISGANNENQLPHKHAFLQQQPVKDRGKTTPT